MVKKSTSNRMDQIAGEKNTGVIDLANAEKNARANGLGVLLHPAANISSVPIPAPMDVKKVENAQSSNLSKATKTTANKILQRLDIEPKA
jgi:hypothetical protein